MSKSYLTLVFRQIQIATLMTTLVSFKAAISDAVGQSALLKNDNAIFLYFIDLLFCPEVDWLDILKFRL